VGRLHVLPYHIQRPNIPGAITAVLTNPIWVVKVRMFTTSPDSPSAYRGLVRTFVLHKRSLYSNIGVDGLGRIYHEEGPRGWWKGILDGSFWSNQWRTPIHVL
jgi:hypothetical protein